MSGGGFRGTLCALFPPFPSRSLSVPRNREFARLQSSVTLTDAFVFSADDEAAGWSVWVCRVTRDNHHEDTSAGKYG